MSRHQLIPAIIRVLESASGNADFAFIIRADFHLHVLVEQLKDCQVAVRRNTFKAWAKDPSSHALFAGRSGYAMLISRVECLM
jgi:hypothetical protein